MALANGALILRYKALSGLLGRVYEAKQLVLKFSKGKYANPSRAQKAKRDLAKLEKQLEVRVEALDRWSAVAL